MLDLVIKFALATVIPLIIMIVKNYPEIKKEEEERLRKAKMKNAKVKRIDASKITWVKKNVS